MTQPFFVRTVPTKGAPDDGDLAGRGTLFDFSIGGYNPMEDATPEEEVGPDEPESVVTAKGKPVSQMTPEEHQNHKVQQGLNKQKAQQGLAESPAHVNNIIDHFNQATPDEIEHGKTWYQDAHAAAKQIAADSGISVKQAAGLIANYSPQQHWAQNLRMASIAAMGRRGIGGKGSGFMASSSQSRAADRILAGEDYQNIFRGKKIKAFGHLIEHGRDIDPENPAVVVDRHALGVVHGRYADEDMYGASGVSGGRKGVYEGYSKHYRDAARQLQAQGHDVNPHQLQAITWLTRQRLNVDGGYSTTDPKKASRVKKVAEAFTNKWNEHAAKVHPKLVGKVPGTGFSSATMQGGQQVAAYYDRGVSSRRITTSTERAEDYR